MSDFGSLETDDLVKLALASRGQGEFFDEAAEFDDDDEMLEFDDDDEDFDSDEMVEFDDDDEDFDDDEMVEFDDDDETFFDGESDFSERRRRRRRRRRKSFRRPRFRRVARRRRIPRARGSRSTTLRGRNGQRMRVRFGKSFATTQDVNKLIKSTEKRFAEAMKERKANHNALSKRIASATRNLDGKVASLRKNVKELEKRTQTSSLLGLLQGAPKAETITLKGNDAGTLEDKVLQAEITFKKQDMLLPLLLTGGLGGGSGSGDMMTMALLMSNRS